jgi:hypothetical protein
VTPNSNKDFRAQPYPGRFAQQIDAALIDWLNWLPNWQSRTTALHTLTCEVCPRFAAELQLLEISHDPMHSLFSSVDALIGRRFATEVAELFPELYAGGFWTVRVERGEVRIATNGGTDVDDLADLYSAIGQVKAIDGAPAWLDPQTVSGIRLLLGHILGDIIDAAVSRLAVQHSIIVAAAVAHIEPAVQRMADELVLEVSKSV